MNAAARQAGRSGAGRRWITLALLLAFAIQSYVFQTHVHALASQAVFQQSSAMPSHGKTPDGAFDCPLCQAITHAGMFLLPAVPFVILARPAITLPSFSPTVRTIVAASARHGRSRAPPAHA
jgi:hypothetical protein